MSLGVKVTVANWRTSDKPAQGGRTFKDEIGRELGLIDEPTNLVASEFFGQQRIDQPCITLEDLGPIELGETIGLALHLGRIVELGESVVLEHEAQAQTSHLLREPIVAVDVDLEGIGCPGLQADVNEAQLWIEEIVVKHALLPLHRDEARPFVRRPEVKRIAGFLGAEDADQPVFDALLANEAFGPLVLFEGTGAIQIGAAAFLREALGVVDQCLGELGARTLMKCERRTRRT